MKKQLRYLLYTLLFFMPSTLLAQIANHVVMSQVYGGGGNTNAPWTNDFVELYNPTSSDVTMTNWSLQYTSAAGTTWGSSGTTLASFSGTIKAHGYFLIGLAAGTTVTNKPLPTTDATGTINMSASAGKVALVNNSTVISQVANPTDASIVDLIGFYTAGGATVTNGFETAVLTVPSTVTSNTWAAQRVANATSTATTLSAGGSDASAGNGWDANNNSTDFVVQTTIVPKNSSTPIAPALAPSLSASVPSLSFGNQTNNTTSSPALSYTLTGTNLTANTTVSVTGPFLVSKTATGGFAASITYSTTEVAASPSVYVQFTPTATGAASGSITHASTGVTSPPTVTLSGTGVPPAPTVTPSTSSITFVGQTTNTTSAAQTFTLAAANLTAGVTVTATAPYTISKDGTTYSTVLTYLSTDFATAQTISVKFTPLTLGAQPGTITFASTGLVSPPTVTLSGTGVVPNPSLSVNPSTLTFNATVGTTSAAQTYTLGGANLTAGVTLNTALPYAISKDGITYGQTLSYLSTDFSTNQTVYVQFSPTTGGAANGSITQSSTNATTQTVTLNGTGVAIPVLTATPTPLAFGNQVINLTSAPQTFTLSGTNLTVNTTVTASALFTVSKTATGTYASSISYTPAELATAQTVYVAFSPTAIAAATGTVTVATPLATSQTVNLTGTGIAPLNTAPTLNAISDVAICATATPVQQTIALSGITPGIEPTQSTVLSISSNNAGLFSSLGVFPIQGTTTGQINYTIASGASGSAIVTVTVKDNGGTLNGGVDTYIRTFNITVSALPTVGITSNVGSTITRGVTAQLSAPSGAASYTWTGNDIVSGQGTSVLTVRPKTSGTYSVTVTNASGCAATQTFAFVVTTSYPLVTNNILTPNGDGKNDTWIIKNIDYYPNSYVKVVDKAGKLVFEATGYQNDWAGTYHGTPLTQGTYFYVIDLGSGAAKYSGYITLIRD